MINPSDHIDAFTNQVEAAGLNVRAIVAALFEHNPLDWRVHAQIIPDYMPPYPSADTKPSVMVKYGNSFLRYSHGPRQGFFWDGYGDDLKTVGLAFRALIEAPTPPHLWFREAHCAKEPTS